MKSTIPLKISIDKTKSAHTRTAQRGSCYRVSLSTRHRWYRRSTPSAIRNHRLSTPSHGLSLTVVRCRSLPPVVYRRPRACGGRIVRLGFQCRRKEEKSVPSLIQETNRETRLLCCFCALFTKVLELGYSVKRVLRASQSCPRRRWSYAEGDW